MAVFRKNRGQTNKAHFVSTENMKQNCAGIEVYPDTEYAEGIKFQEANIRPYLKKAWLATFSGACSADVLALCPVDILPSFLFSVIGRDSFFDYVMSGAKGSKMPRGDKTHIMTYSFGVPGCEEQKRISDMMALLDKRIDAQRRLVESLKSYKRGLSNALFERVIEFCSGSDNKWTQFPLGDLGEFYNGLTGKQKTDFEHGSEPYIPYVNVYKNMVADTSACESVSVSEREHQNKVRYGDILFTQSSETLEEVGLSSVWLGDFEPFLNSFCFGIHFHENLCIFPLYVAHYFRSTDARLKIMHEGQGITRVNLSAERIKAISIPLPPMEVQKKIGMFLKSLNDKINEKQEIICQMEHLKIGLLQQLFI